METEAGKRRVERGGRKETMNKNSGVEKNSQGEGGRRRDREMEKEREGKEARWESMRGRRKTG